MSELGGFGSGVQQQVVDQPDVSDRCGDQRDERITVRGRFLQRVGIDDGGIVQLEARCRFELFSQVLAKSGKVVGAVLTLVASVQENSRERGGDDAVHALSCGFSSSSALLKHEIAYVLGQMQNPSALPCLLERLEDLDEDLMVRHEAAEALGAIGDRRAIEILEKFIDDDEPVISESCEVALDLLEWVRSNRLEYAEF